MYIPTAQLIQAGATIPPGFEFDYVAITANVTTTQTVRASATTVITGNSVTYDGSTVVMVQVYAPAVYNSTTNSTIVTLWEDSTDLCVVLANFVGTATSATGGVTGFVRRTPTVGAHTYTVKVYVGGASTGTFQSTANTGAATASSGFLSVTKVS